MVPTAVLLGEAAGRRMGTILPFWASMISVNDRMQVFPLHCNKINEELLTIHVSGSNITDSGILCYVAYWLPV